MSDNKTLLNDALNRLLLLDKKSFGLYSDDLKVIAEKIHTAANNKEIEGLRVELTEKDKCVEKLKAEVTKNNIQKIFCEGLEDDNHRKVYYENKKLKSELSQKTDDLNRAIECWGVVERECKKEIQRLESELNKCQEKAILWDNLSKSDKLNSLVGGESKFCEKVDKDRIKRLEAELTELKEKHKKDVMEAYGDGWQKGKDNPKMMCVDLEKYYKQTHGE